MNVLVLQVLGEKVPLKGQLKKFFLNGKLWRSIQRSKLFQNHHWLRLHSNRIWFQHSINCQQKTAKIASKATQFHSWGSSIVFQSYFHQILVCSIPAHVIEICIWINSLLFLFGLNLFTFVLSHFCTFVFFVYLLLLCLHPSPAFLLPGFKNRYAWSWT